MWIDQDILIDKKKINGKVNHGAEQSEVELPYFKDWQNIDNIKINDDIWDILQKTNVGDRNEIILLLVKNKMRGENHGQSVKSRKNN